MKYRYLALIACLFVTTGCKKEDKTSVLETAKDEYGRVYDPAWLEKDNVFVLDKNDKYSDRDGFSDGGDAGIDFDTEERTVDARKPVKFRFGCGLNIEEKDDITPFIEFQAVEILPSMQTFTKYKLCTLPNLLEGNYHYTKLCFPSQKKYYSIYNVTKEVYLDFTPWLDRYSSNKTYYFGLRFSLGDQYSPGTDHDNPWQDYASSKFITWQFTPSKDGNTITFSKDPGKYNSK